MPAAFVFASYSERASTRRSTASEQFNSVRENSQAIQSNSCVREEIQFVLTIMFARYSQIQLDGGSPQNMSDIKATIMFCRDLGYEQLYTCGIA